MLQICTFAYSLVLREVSRSSIYRGRGVCGLKLHSIQMSVTETRLKIVFFLSGKLYWGRPRRTDSSNGTSFQKPINNPFKRFIIGGGQWYNSACLRLRTRQKFHSESILVSGGRHQQYTYLGCLNPRWCQKGAPRKLDPDTLIGKINKTPIMAWIDFLGYSCLRFAIQDYLECRHLIQLRQKWRAWIDNTEL